MKKFLVMFAIAGSLVACNNSSEGTDASEDSARIADSLQQMQNGATSDTTNMGGDTTNLGGDTTNTQ